MTAALITGFAIGVITTLIAVYLGIFALWLAWRMDADDRWSAGHDPQGARGG